MRMAVRSEGAYFHQVGIVITYTEKAVHSSRMTRNMYIFGAGPDSIVCVAICLALGFKKHTCMESVVFVMKSNLTSRGFQLIL